MRRNIKVRALAVVILACAAGFTARARAEDPAVQASVLDSGAVAGYGVARLFRSGQGTGSDVGR